MGVVMGEVLVMAEGELHTSLSRLEAYLDSMPKGGKL